MCAEIQVGVFKIQEIVFVEQTDPLDSLSLDQECTAAYIVHDFDPAATLVRNVVTDIRRYPCKQIYPSSSRPSFSRIMVIDDLRTYDTNSRITFCNFH